MDRPLVVWFGYGFSNQLLVSKAYTHIVFSKLALGQYFPAVGNRTGDLTFTDPILYALGYQVHKISLFSKIDNIYLSNFQFP